MHGKSYMLYIDVTVLFSSCTHVCSRACLQYTQMVKIVQHSVLAVPSGNGLLAAIAPSAHFVAERVVLSVKYTVFQSLLAYLCVLVTEQ